MITLDQRFREHIEQSALFNPEHRLLVAVSGGADSMVLLHLLRHNTPASLAVAHCNFGLRGADSDGDQALVEKTAASMKIHCYVKAFDTTKYAEKEGISIQMAARDLRYAWFGELLQEEGFDRVVIAHHRDDVVETVLLNLIRGTGIMGLLGIRAKSGNIVRPLLFASREEIIHYAKETGIVYRDDQSNFDTHYRRNFVRHRIIPLIEELNPAFTDTLIRETESLSSVFEIYDTFVDNLRNSLLKEDNGRYMVKIHDLRNKVTDPHLLCALLSPFNFNLSQCISIMNAFEAEPGRLFMSEEYTLLKDREFIIIEQSNSSTEGAVFKIERNTEAIEQPLNLRFRRMLRTKQFSIPGDRKIAAIDADRITFPLILRCWQPGDYFVPLGMKGRKKLSDFFTDRKIDRMQKTRTWILCNGDEIMWIVGNQLDDRYKITSSTRNILMVEWKE